MNFEHKTSSCIRPIGSTYWLLGEKERKITSEGVLNSLLCIFMFWKHLIAFIDPCICCFATLSFDRSSS